MPSDVADRVRAYLAGVQARVAAGVRTYPALARRAGLQGVVEVAFALAADGSLIALRVAGSSGFEVLDEAALAYVAALAPFQPFPADLPRDPLAVRVPVVYRLR